MELFIKQHKLDIYLALLFTESVALLSVTGKIGFFWFIFILLLLTSFLYSLAGFNSTVKSVFKSDYRYDIAFVTFMTIVLNANITVLTNKFISIIIFAVYYIGIRYFTKIRSGETKTRIQKNILNLFVLLCVFLGSNIFTNLYIAAGKSSEMLAVLIMPFLILGMVFALSYYSFVRNNIAVKWSKVYSWVLAIILTEIFLVSGFYIEEYPSLYRMEDGGGFSITTTALFMTVIYYSLYGLMIHKIDKKFHPKTILEYISISVIIITTLFLTIKWFGG